MESMKGFVTFEDKKYPFSFSGERLALYPDEFSSQSLQEFFAPFERGNTIKDIELNGNLDIQFDKWHIFGFAIIETLLYAMRLKALGIDERKIQEGLIQVMGYNFSLDR